MSITTSHKSARNASPVTPLAKAQLPPREESVKLATVNLSMSPDVYTRDERVHSIKGLHTRPITRIVQEALNYPDTALKLTYAGKSVAIRTADSTATNYSIGNLGSLNVPTQGLITIETRGVGSGPAALLKSVAKILRHHG